MPLPTPTLNVPSLQPDQLQFQGLLMGVGTPFQLKEIDGLERAKSRSGNTPRPRSRGSFVGLNLPSTRTLTATIDVGPFAGAEPYGSYGTLAGALNALDTALQTEGTTEYPLWLRVRGFQTVCSMARVLQAQGKWDITADLGGLVQGIPIQFEATDPYLYSAPTSVTTIGLPGPSTGFNFPITFPLQFGGGSNPDQATIINTGDVDCWPVLVISGPCLNPSVVNETTPGDPAIILNTQLNTGDQVVIDTDLQSIILYPAGQTTGQLIPGALQEGSTFWPLLPGSNIVGFNSSDGNQVSGTVAVWSASAWGGLVA